MEQSAINALQENNAQIAVTLKKAWQSPTIDILDCKETAANAGLGSDLSLLHS